MQQICHGRRAAQRLTRLTNRFRRHFRNDLFSFWDVAKQRQQNNNNKSFGPTSPGVARDSFFSFLLFIYYYLLFIYFIYFINSIQFRTYFINSIQVLTFLKDARTRRLPESTARSSRARSHGLTGPLRVRLCDPYVLARPRQTLQETWTQACSCQVSKKIKKIEQNPEKRKKILVDPGRHFPVPYNCRQSLLVS